MQFKLASIFGLIVVARADSLQLFQDCSPPDTGCEAMSGKWYTDYGGYTVTIYEGCQGGLGVPGLERVCMSFEEEIMFFQFGGQGERCMTYSGRHDVAQPIWIEFPCPN